MTTKEYWQKIRAIAGKFDPESLQKDREEEDLSERYHLRKSEHPVWLMSLTNPEKGSIAGACVLMKPYAAAERIFAQTHREATPEEIATEETRRADERVRILREDADKKQSVTTHTHVTVDTGAIADQVADRLSNQKPARRERTAEPVPANAG